MVAYSTWYGGQHLALSVCVTDWLTDCFRLPACLTV
jgi:hypothetical protein